MERAAVVPDGDVVDVLPSEPDLQVVVINAQLVEPIKHVLALFSGQAVDMANVRTDGVYRLPARHRVRADDGMDGLEDGPDVFWSAARLVVELEAASLSGGIEVRLTECAGQVVDELLVNGRKT